MPTPGTNSAPALWLVGVWPVAPVQATVPPALKFCSQVPAATEKVRLSAVNEALLKISVVCAAAGRMTLPNASDSPAIPAPLEAHPSDWRINAPLPTIANAYDTCLARSEE